MDGYGFSSGFNPLSVYFAEALSTYLSTSCNTKKGTHNVTITPYRIDCDSSQSVVLPCNIPPTLNVIFCKKIALKKM